MPQSTDADQVQTTANNDFMKMVQLDGGRGYISVDSVKAVIDQMALYDYDYLVLGFGNDGMRFLLNDMTVNANGNTYEDAIIRNAIVEKNDKLAPNAKGVWSEDDMNAILDYANQKDISIVPMLNTPGHATSIVAAMTACGINAELANRNGSDDYGSVTFDVTNSDAVAFMKAFVQKYIDYFSGKSQYLNLGMDEYAGNKAGWKYMNGAEQAALGTYLKDLVDSLATAGMTPMAFCDVIGNMDSVPSSVIGINWDSGCLKDHSNINANSGWYYVLGSDSATWAGYNLALFNTQNTPVTTTKGGEAGAGSLLAIWNDNNLPFTADELAKVNTLIKTQAENNSAYFTVQGENPDPTPVEATDIWVQVGKTYEKNITGNNYAGTCTTDDTSIATVTVNGKDAVEATTTYIEANNVKVNTLISDNSTDWKAVPGYYYTSDDGANYYPLYAKRSTSNGVGSLRNYYYTWGYSTTGSATDAIYIGEQTNKWNESWQNINIPIYTVSGTSPATPASTTITFYGHKVGTTYVTVGGTTYAIHVTNEDLNKVTQTYHPWISTYAVYPEGTGSDKCETNQGVARDVTIAAITPGVYSEQGAEISTLVDEKGDWCWEGSAQTVYWKGTILSKENRQEGNKKDDQSMNGTDFTRIRYWNGEWSYSNPDKGVDWTPIKDTDEVCVYYLQQTSVTKEVDTYVKDWALTTQNAATDANTNKDAYQKALSFAVVYPNGDMNPTTEREIYQNSTLIYYDNLNPLTFIRIGTNESYEVAKITYTFGSRNGSSDKLWQPNDSIKWETEKVGDNLW